MANKPDSDFVTEDLPAAGTRRPARSYAAPTALQAGLGRTCPRCGQGKLYGALLAVKPECEVCGLDFTKVDTGDGPAVFVILILGFLVVLGAFIVDAIFAPPYWAHAIIWAPVIIGGSIAMLSVLKAALIALEYQNKAREGRLDTKDK